MKLSKNTNDCTVLGLVDYRATDVKYGNNLHIDPNVCFWGDGKITIGNNVTIGHDTIIFSSVNGGINIGNNVSIAAHCYIIDSDHGIKRNELINKQKLNSKNIIIEDDVWIADNCTILKGSHISKGAVIGAKSLVNNHLPSYSINVGIPAKTIKYRE